MNRLIAIFLLYTVFLAPAATFANNPFVAGAPRATPPGVEKRSAFFNPVVAKMVMFQHSLKQKITRQVRRAKAEKSLKPLFTLVLLSFSYGVLHAAGPGHGKAIATSYLFSRGRRFGNGLLLGNLIALFHALSAVVLVVMLREVLDVSITGSLDKTILMMQKISYALIAMMGTGLLVRNLINWCRHKHQEKPPQALPMGRNILAMAFCTGMVPCPGVVLIMLFTMSMDMMGLGVVLSLSTALGMGVTISAVVTVVLKGKTMTLGSLDQRPGLAETVELSFELAGALMVTLLGLLLFGALPPPL
jgi:ABC-type nickel/cobalt efflux system permease component RcnA